MSRLFGSHFPRRPHISFWTATGCYNLGDELIIRAEVDTIRSYFPESDCTILTYDQESTLIREPVRYISYFPNGFLRHPLRNLIAFLRNAITIARSDLLIIGGGGIFFDNEPSASFSTLLWQWRLRIIIARIFRVPIFFWSVGIEVRDYRHRQLLALLFKNIYYTITVRDTQSLNILSGLEIPAILLHDPVFLTPPKPPHPSGSSLRIGISLRDGFLSPNGRAEMIGFLSFLESEGHTLIFLGHSFSQNLAVNDLTFYESLFPEKKLSLTKTMRETLEAYEALDCVIGMRYHAAILAASQSLPLLLIPYGPKNEALISILGITEYIAPESVSLDRLQYLWGQLSINLDTRKQVIHESYTRTHALVRHTLTTLIS